ncbi:MAG: hypothetical protein ACR2MX_00650, partial [Cyclobacteriaceae bacterium]
MRKLVLCLGVFLLWLPLKAQIKAPTRVDKVVLINGSVLYGWVTETYGDDMMTIDIDTETQVRLSANKVEKVKYNRPNPQLIYSQRQKYFHRFEAGILLGRTSEWTIVDGTFTAHTVHGYQLTDLLGIGVGAGYDRYGTSQHLPIYLGLSGEVLHGRLSPYYFINTGFSHAWDRQRSNFQDVVEADGGLMFQAGAGLKINLYKHSLLLSVSYKQQESRLYTGGDGVPNRLSFT